MHSKLGSVTCGPTRGHGEPQLDGEPQQQLEPQLEGELDGVAYFLRVGAAAGLPGVVVTWQLVGVQFALRIATQRLECSTQNAGLEFAIVDFARLAPGWQ